VFAFRASAGPVELAFTDRHGGVSTGPYASLNLAASSGESATAVAENLRRAVVALTTVRTDAEAPTDAAASAATEPPPVIGMHQVHGNQVAVVGPEDAAGGGFPVADALVTAQPGLVLMARAADCVPVLLADPEAGVVAAVHSGRPGVAAGVVTRAVETMRECGAERILGWVGPHVCGACYEVPEPLREEVAAVVPETFATTSWGTPSLAIGAGVTAQLIAAGVEVRDAASCTREDDDLFSYRRQGKASGRLAGLIWIRP